MKRLAVLLAATLLLTACATAPDPDNIEVRLRCYEGKVQALVGASGPGVIQFTIPKDLCGTDI